MPRDVVRELLPRRATLVEAAALAEVLDEAWGERRLRPHGSPQRAIAEAVVRNVVERLQRLPPVPARSAR